MILTEFGGFSGARIFLVSEHGHLFVRKVGDFKNISRNYQRLTALANDFPVPTIYKYDGATIEIEYIPGLDVETFLLRNSAEELLNFLFEILEKFSKNVTNKDYTLEYIEQLDRIEFNNSWPFDKHQLISALPKVLPSSEYFGDLTLENIICSDEHKFYLIDGLESQWNSYVFDIAKLRQDLECGWFLRNKNLDLDIKLKYIQRSILEKYPVAGDNSILILMLIRVYAYTVPGSHSRKFINDEIIRLWK
jgi:RIO-like serine/threonine protein kinase